MSHSVASDLVLHCLTMLQRNDLRLICVKVSHHLNVHTQWASGTKWPCSFIIIMDSSAYEISILLQCILALTVEMHN